MSNTITRDRLVKELYHAHGFNHTEAKKIVDAFFMEFQEAFRHGESVKLSGFGAFHVLGKAKRVGRNPKTKEPAVIPERNVIRFRLGNKLKNQINERTEQTLNKSIDFISE